jgi:pimeloyl-ACP methyl ester carboxylesterase
MLSAADYGNQFASDYMEVQGLRLHYKSGGEGPPVILLHGAANDWHEWERNLEPLARNFHVYALDLPGFGSSSPAGRDLASSWLILLLKGFMHKLGLEQASIIGHSLGGLIAMEMALNYPDMVDKLVLVNSAGLGDVSPLGTFLLYLVRNMKRLFGRESSRQFSTDARERWLLLQHLKEIKCPVLLVWGEHDPYFPKAYALKARDLILLARLEIFPGCRHAPHREKSQKFDTLVTQFLKDGIPGG